MLSIPRIAQVAAVLAVVGAGASMLGPDERWWGVDIGATGAAVFGFTLWAGAVLFARYPDAIFPAEWSIAERRAWVGLLFLSLVLVNFLRYMVGISDLDAAPVSIAQIPSRQFMWILFVLLVARAVVAKALRGPAADIVELDERDLRLKNAADRGGSWAFTFVVTAVVLMLAYVPPERLEWWLSPLIAANVLIGLLIGRAVIEHVCLVTCYALERR